MTKSKLAKRRILMPVGTPSVPLEEIRRAVKRVKAARKERKRAAKQMTDRAKAKRKVPRPKGTPSFSYEEAKRVIESIMAVERQKKAKSTRNSR